MTIQEQAKKEIDRINRSFRYREKKNGFLFPKGKENIANQILNREVKRFTQTDLEKLKQVKGEELYKYGKQESSLSEQETLYIDDDISTIEEADETQKETPFTVKELTQEERQRIREEKFRTSGPEMK